MEIYLIREKKERDSSRNGIGLKITSSMKRFAKVSRAILKYEIAAIFQLNVLKSSSIAVLDWRVDTIANFQNGKISRERERESEVRSAN